MALLLAATRYLIVQKHELRIRDDNPSIEQVAVYIAKTRISNPTIRSVFKSSHGEPSPHRHRQTRLERRTLYETRSPKDTQADSDDSGGDNKDGVIQRTTSHRVPSSSMWEEVK